MRSSIILSAGVAAFVGFGGTAAIVLQAAQAVGATQAESASWLAAISLAIIATSAFCRSATAFRASPPGRLPARH